MKPFLSMILMSALCAALGLAQVPDRSFHSPTAPAAIPFIGAQVFIEPGQTKDEIDTWFRLLKENGFTVCRIRMFESYMRDEQDHWDFTLFDQAFEAAGRHGIQIYATLFPLTEKTDIGGIKFPRSEEHLKSLSNSIEKMVAHFSRFESLCGWVLINEPGVGGKAPQNEFSDLKLKEWRVDHPAVERTPGGFPVLVDFEQEQFLMDYETWFLRWVAAEIRKHDTTHDLHVNNHAIFTNCAEYDFPAWRSFLTSLGGSAHASWHFSYFTRPQYALAMSADCEIIHSGAGSIPWLMTELQGGNNTYSGGQPMCPTKDEIAQWLWIILGTQAKGAIFWSLNPRSVGIEAGEWALLDFQNRPSDRMIEAARVARIVRENGDRFSVARKVDSHISILYVRESLWAESKMTIYPSPYQARNTGGVMKSALGYFEALSEMGISPNLKSIDEFDFPTGDCTGETIILSQQIAMPKRYVKPLEDFTARGGKLIVDGMTAFFDGNMQNTMKTGFDFKTLFGGDISEFKFVADSFQLETDGFKLPAHLWQGFPVNHTGVAISGKSHETVGIRNAFGKGEVLWVPTLLGLGSRISGDYRELCRFLSRECSGSLDAVPVKFSVPHAGMLMKTLQSKDALITVVVNKNVVAQTVDLDFKRKDLKPQVLYATGDGKTAGRTIVVQPEESKVIVWE